MAITDDGPTAGLQELLGEAEVRGQRVTVRWAEGRMDGDAELVARVERVAGGAPGTAIEFLRALRSLGGRVVSSAAAVTGAGARMTLSRSAPIAGS